MIGNVALDTRNGNIYVFDGQFIWVKPPKKKSKSLSKELGLYTILRQYRSRY